ncbi:MAG TPA: hypothetical protein VJN21_04605 [Candidatus Acidoferrales bacterium]|nr:hypothetical protein [Candidatus Acidoferrales bacterium]
MRRMWILVLGMALVSGMSAFAATGGDKTPAHPDKKSPATSATTKDDNAAKGQPAKPDGAASAAEVQKLEDLIRAQQEELAAQHKALDEQQKEIDSLTGKSNASSASPAMKVQLRTEPSSPGAAAMAATESSSSHVSAAVAKPTTAGVPKAAPSKGGASDPPQAEEKKPEAIELAGGKIQLGATFFGDYTYYNDTGFGPQFLTQENQEGPGNSGFNSFDVTRTYINFIYSPNEMVTLRVTPNIFRQVDGTSGAIANGNGAQIGGSTNGNLSFRLKYAYVDFNQLFKNSEAFKKDKITFGQTQQPLTDWEEGLSGYRYTYLTPWNYLSLSSTYVGARLHGPIERNGKEYLDYDLGVFTTASFHAIEQNDKKQVMGRLTWYPVGTKSDRTGFGLTVFEDYGYNTKLPSQTSTPLNRLAVFAHFQSHDKGYEIVGEYDLGRNSFSAGNLFSGAAPVAGGPFDAGGGANDVGTVAGTVLAGDTTRQQGYAFFGHARLGHSPFTLWGIYHYFQPNTKFAGTDPLDFSRTIGGISYHVNKYFDFSVGDENFHWLHPQGMAGAEDTNAIALWTQFNF